MSSESGVRMGMGDATGDDGLVVARFGEIALKGRNRPRFVDQVRFNIGERLRVVGIQGEVRKVEQRFYVRTPEPELAAQALTRVFGVTSVSPAVSVPRDIASIRQAALTELRRGGFSEQCSLRAAARRTYKDFPLTSPEINREVGGFLHDELGGSVDLSNAADFTIGVEIMRDHALVYARSISGAGGMPVPLSGRLVCLMSGGLDSPVAAWMMMKRGAAIIPVHLAQSEQGTERFLALCEVLQQWSQGWRIKPIVLSHVEALGGVRERLVENKAGRWACLFCKRAMLRVASEVARRHKALGVVLGDSLGQVASQTLENMRIISSGCEFPIYRPLVGMDKVEVMALARKVGTYALSARYSAPCPFLPENPVTQASFDKFQALLPLLAEQVCG
jgi:thiamine biosynthesis protein ThiI